MFAMAQQWGRPCASTSIWHNSIKLWVENGESVQLSTCGDTC